MPLGYALVCGLAERHGIRCLAIKGPVLELQGLREPRQSVDVDVLVDPGRLGDLCALLEQAGWGVRIVSTSAKVLPSHSVTLMHPVWPAEVDVHNRFPGFLLAPERVFEALWSRRSTVELAHRSVACTDRAGSAAVSALHVLRDPERRAHEVEALAKNLVENFTADELREVVSVAQATGATQPLAPLLAAVGVQPEHPVEVPVEALAAWRLRTAASDKRSVAWVQAFREASVGQWPGLVVRAVLLTEPEIRNAFPDLPPGRLGLWRGRWWRLRRGLRALPQAVALVRGQRGRSQN